MRAETSPEVRTPTEENIAVAVEQTRASDLAERHLRSLIFSGRLRPGDKLPSERELAAQFGIARITLRAALRSLETVGFLVIKIGSKGGAWINDSATIMARWEEWMRAHEHQIGEMLEFRRVVETTIASLAAERRTAEELDTLESISARKETDRPSIVTWHFDFHDALANAAHNRYLTEAMINIRGQLFVPTDWVLTEPQVVDIEGVHDRILEAVRDQDSGRAAKEMAAHLERGGMKRASAPAQVSPALMRKSIPLSAVNVPADVERPRARRYVRPHDVTPSRHAVGFAAGRDAGRVQVPEDDRRPVVVEDREEHLGVVPMHERRVREEDELHAADVDRGRDLDDDRGPDRGGERREHVAARSVLEDVVITDHPEDVRGAALPGFPVVADRPGDRLVAPRRARVGDVARDDQDVTLRDLR